jgi:hypothetical protein
MQSRASRTSHFNDAPFGRAHTEVRTRREIRTRESRAQSSEREDCDYIRRDSFYFVNKRGGECSGELGSAVGGGAALVRSGAAAGSVGSRGTQRRHERLAGGTGGQANQPLTACKRARDGLVLEAHFL